MKRVLLTILVSAGLSVFTHGCHAREDDIRERQAPTWAHLWSFAPFAYFIWPRKRNRADINRSSRPERLCRL
jgi:hypothetical protein